MTFSAFDSESWDAGQLASEASRPFWTIKDEGDKAILNWIANKFSSLTEEARPRLVEAKKMLRLISGVRNTDSSQSLNDAMLGKGKGRKPPAIVVNHPWDLTEQRIATVSRFRPALSITPATADYKDRVSAQVVKAWIEYQTYIRDFDVFFQAAARLCFVCGEAYSFVDWDDHAGNLMPEWEEEQKAAKAEGRKPGVPYMDEKGALAQHEDGSPKLINVPVKQGDVSPTLLSMFDVFPVRKGADFKRWTEFFRVKWVDADELKRQFPQFANQIQPASQYASKFDPVSLQDSRSTNEVMVLVYERMPDEFMPEGCVIECLPQLILSNDPYYSHGMQPYCRYTDLDHPGDLWGQSYLKNVKPLSQTINDITSMARRSFLLMAHPKWALPMNSVVKKEQLGNDTGLVEYKGSQPPTIINAPVIPPDYFTFRDNLKSEMNQLATINDVTRGNVPKRVDSGIALQYLDEQTNERANVAVLKYQRFQRDTFSLMLGVASKKYKQGDGRMLPIMGGSQKYEIQDFDPSHLNKPMHIRFESSSALPQSRAIRTQSIIDLKTAFPGMITDRQVMDILEFGQEEKFYDVATVALRAAESKIQDLLLGKPVSSPQKHEDLLTLRDVVVREMQTRDFNTNVPQEIQDSVHSFLQQIECLMFERAVGNPVFAQACGGLPDFPLEYDASPDELQSIGRATPASVAAPSVDPSTAPPPASALQSAPSAGAPGAPAIPPPAAPQPTPNSMTPTDAVPPVQQPTTGG